MFVTRLLPREITGCYATSMPGRAGFFVRLTFAKDKRGRDQTARRFAYRSAQLRATKPCAAAPVLHNAMSFRAAGAEISSFVR